MSADEGCVLKPPLPRAIGIHALKAPLCKGSCRRSRLRDCPPLTFPSGEGGRCRRSRRMRGPPLSLKAPLVQKGAAPQRGFSHISSLKVSLPARSAANRHNNIPLSREYESRPHSGRGAEALLPSCKRKGIDRIGEQPQTRGDFCFCNIHIFLPRLVASLP